MKTQMRFQKILMIVTLIIGALGVVFALAFCSGGFNQLCLLDGEDIDGLEDFIKTVQSANDTLFILGVVYVVVCVLPLIAACQKRRNYYITNYIAIGIVVVFQIVFSVVVLITVLNVLQSFNAVDLAECQSTWEFLDNSVEFGKFNSDPWTPKVGYALVAISLVDAVLLVLNAVWKFLLMRGEKKLLQGKPEEPVEGVDANDEVVSEVV